MLRRLPSRKQRTMHVRGIYSGKHTQVRLSAGTSSSLDVLPQVPLLNIAGKDDGKPSKSQAKKEDEVCMKHQWYMVKNMVHGFIIKPVRPTSSPMVSAA